MFCIDIVPLSLRINQFRRFRYICEVDVSGDDDGNKGNDI